MSVVERLDGERQPFIDQAQDAPTFDPWVDRCMLFGVLASLVLSGIDPRLFGIESDDTFGQTIAAASRLVVFVPLMVAIAAGVPAMRVLRRAPVGLAVAFGAWTVFAAAFTEAPIAEVDRALWFFGFILLVVMATVRLGWEQLLVSVGVVTTVLIIAGLGGHYLGLVPSTATEFFDGGLFGIERVKGLSTQANIFGRSCAYLTLIGLILLTSSGGYRRTPPAMIFIAVGLCGLLASQSRFSIISLLLAGSMVLARPSRRATYPAAAMILLVGACAGVVLVAGSLGPFARSTDTGEATSLLGRTEVWEEAIDVTLENSAFGMGTETLTDRYLFLEESGSFSWNATSAHNVVLQLSASHGIIGACLFLLAMALGLARSVTSPVVGTCEVMIMFVVQGFVESILIGNPTVAPLLLVGALVADALARLEGSRTLA